MDEATRFTHIFEQHGGQVLRYCLRRIGRDVAQDVVAETFTIAWRRLDKVPIDDPLPWLLVVARNLISEEHRRYAGRGPVSAASGALDVGKARDHEPDVAVEVTERLVVTQALGTLSAQDREILILTGWDGLSARSAARVVNCSTATFSVRLHRARGRLAAAMRDADALHSGGDRPPVAQVDAR